MKEITLELTDYCPFNCPFCSSDANPDGGKRMSRATRGKSLNGLYDVINLSGGEPLSHPDIWEFITVCRQHLKPNGELWIYTNMVDGIRFNGHVRDRVKVHMNVVADKDVDQIHVLKAVEHGRQAERPKVSISGHDCKNCDHVEVRPDGRVEKPCRKTRDGNQ